MARAAAYIPESARTGASSAAATAGAGLASAGGYLREGVNNVLTPERADQASQLSGRRWELISRSNLVWQRSAWGPPSW